MVKAYYFYRKSSINRKAPVISFYHGRLHCMKFYHLRGFMDVRRVQRHDLILIHLTGFPEAKEWVQLCG